MFLRFPAALEQRRRDRPPASRRPGWLLPVRTFEDGLRPLELIEDGTELLHQVGRKRFLISRGIPVERLPNLTGGAVQETLDAAQLSPETVEQAPDALLYVRLVVPGSYRSSRRPATPRPG